MIDSTNQYELSVIVKNVKITEYSHQGNYYVEGRDGSEYSLRILNKSNERIMAILSVDGLGIIDGLPAGPKSRGFIVSPNEVVDVPGWILNSDSVASFKFGASDKSYSNRTGRGKKNLGVIGMMVFRQKVPVYNTTMFGGISLSSTIGSPISSIRKDTMSSASPSVTQSLGTEFGDRADFNTTSVEFEKRDENYPDAIICLYYDSAEGLEARGIVLPHRSTTPQAFPSYVDASRFGLPIPPGWTG